MWIKTEDDGCGKITKHLPFNFDQSIERIIKCSTKDNDACLLINIDEKFKGKINYENVKA